MAGARHPFGRSLGAEPRDGGAAAVEFALVAILLLMLVFGIAEFGRMWFLQSSLSAAARDAARTMAVKDDQAEAEIAARTVFTAGDELTGIEIDASECDSGGSVKVSLSYNAAFITGFFTPIFGESVTLAGQGVMRCGG